MRTKATAPVPCIYCGTPFTPRPSRVREGRGSFCSVRCANASRGNRITRRCAVCGASFTVAANHVLTNYRPAQYCSIKCAHAARSIPAEERFWAKVNKDGPVVRAELGPCWLWLGGIKSTGYGHFMPGGGTRASVSVHRFSYALHRGPIPDGMLVCHICDNRSCVNPAHLFIGTALDNVSDMWRKNRARRRSGPDWKRRKIWVKRPLSDTPTPS